MAHPQRSFIHTTFAPNSLAGRRREAAFSNTLPYQLGILKQTGRYDAFKLQWHPIYDEPPTVWPVPQHLFWDSDVAKWIEGACYFLHWKYDAEVDAAIRDLVAMIRQAQQPDGYINIHFTVVEPDKRFTNLRDLHELYNAGHLIEAALAHHQLYNNNDLLDPIVRYVDLLCKTFGPGPNQIPGYPGHPEIELALLRLYSVTQNSKYLSLARYFLTERGNPAGDNGRHFYKAEARRRGEDEKDRPGYWPEYNCLWYYQAHKPIVDQCTIEGHSVRAVYLLTGVADLLLAKKDADTSRLKEAVHRLWNNMVERKMYATGGIGAIKQYEGFGQDYFLPQGTDEGGCYSETCASIGVMMLAERLLQDELDGSIADIMELSFYNVCLSGMSYDGKKFTYVNQLASSDADPSVREEWFTCSCCPPNILRLLGYLGGYLWTFHTDAATQSAQINVHMFSSATLAFSVDQDSPITLQQTTDYPWKGDIHFSLESPAAASIRTSINIRIPGWAGQNWTLSPPAPKAQVKNGYLALSAEYLASHPEFTLSIPLRPRLLSPHPYTNQDTVTLARGPIVYCVEDVDNAWVQDHFKTLLFDPKSAVVDEKELTDPATGETYVALKARRGGFALMDLEKVNRAGPCVEVDGVEEDGKGEGGVASDDEVATRGIPFKPAPAADLNFIPYFFHASRGGKGHMRVGLRRWHR